MGHTHFLAKVVLFRYYWYYWFPRVHRNLIDQIKKCQILTKRENLDQPLYISSYWANLIFGEGLILF